MTESGRHYGVEAPALTVEPVRDDLAVVDDPVIAGVVDGDGATTRPSVVALMCIRSAIRFLSSRRSVRVGQFSRPLTHRHSLTQPVDCVAVDRDLAQSLGVGLFVAASQPGAEVDGPAVAVQRGVDEPAMQAVAVSSMRMKLACSHRPIWYWITAMSIGSPQFLEAAPDPLHVEHNEVVTWYGKPRPGRYRRAVGAAEACYARPPPPGRPRQASRRSAVRFDLTHIYVPLWTATSRQLELMPTVSLRTDCCRTASTDRRCARCRTRRSP